MKFKQIIQNIDFINHAYTNYKWREKKLSRGTQNREKTFYVVRRANANVGLFSLVLTSLGQMKYALDKGYIPVVDMSNYAAAYEGADRDGSNIWEYFFEQPCGFDLNRICNSRHVILGNGIISPGLNYPGGSTAYNEEELEYWQGVAKDCLIVNADIAAQARQMADSLFSGKKILGVLARGTDYINAKPYNHPIQPTPEQLMEKIDTVMELSRCDKIYLATEDKGFYERFKEKYGDRLIAVEARRYETLGKENINVVRKAEEKDGYTMGKDYLITILLLSRCHCLVAGNTSGTIGALLLNKSYEYKYIFDLGVYGIDGER